MSSAAWPVPPAGSRSPLFGFCFLALALLLAACSGGSGEKGGEKGKSGGKGGRGDMPTPVTLGTAVQRDVPIQAEVIGSVESSAVVSLKPQISGQIINARFREGDFVQKGQLLVEIDPRALEAQLAQLQAQNQRDRAALGQAEANLARDKAQQENIRRQLDRAVELSRQGIISKEQYDTISTNAAAYEATIRADQAAIENSKAQIAASAAAIDNQKVLLGYTKIYAPISGRTGSMTVKPGNIVTANTTELATINQVEPVFVTFALPEMHLTALRRAAGQKLPVTASPEEGGAPQRGTLAFFENTVDPLTGTVKAKATFENHGHALWPGQFVRVTLKLGEHSKAVLIPSQAVQSGQDGTFAYVVKEDQRVELRQITASQRLGDETVIERGIQPGDKVVTEGTLRLVPGARVSERAAGGRGGAGRGPGGPNAAAGGEGAGRPEGAPGGEGGEGKKGGRREGAAPAEGATKGPGEGAPAGGEGGGEKKGAGRPEGFKGGGKKGPATE